jgi:4-alpha-glucanotransferase
MYLDLEQIGEIPDKKKFCALRKELNAQKFVDYEAVNNHKWEIIRSIFAKDKGKTLNSLDFKTFHNNNKEWLDAYAVFSYLRDKFGTANFDDWGDDAKYSEKRVAEYCNPKNPEYQKVAIYQFVQYHLDKQLKSVCEYAHERGVALKGDIPIGVNRCSVDVWSNLPCSAATDKRARRLTTSPPTDQTGDSLFTIGKRWPRTITHGGQNV